MSQKKIMVIGLGYVGNYALEFLVRTQGVDSIFAADIDNEVGLSKTNNAILGAAQMGFYPRVEFIPLDLFNMEETTSILKKTEPDVILSCVTLQSARVILEIPEDLYKRFRLVAGLGPWLPMHLTLNYKLMQAVKNAGIKTHVIVASFPDAVCPVLAKVGLAPTVGLGNLDLFIPGLKKIVGEKLGIPMRNVSIYMIGYHALWTTMRINALGEVPYYVKIFVQNKEVTGEFNLDRLIVDAANLVVRWRIDSEAAASGVKNVLGILNNTGELAHAPGPQGLPGGYPVRLNSRGAEVVLPEGLSLEEAIRINEEGQKYDGIEKIEEDGTVFHTERAVEFMKETLGYDCSRIKIEENEEKAKELGSLYREFAEKLKKNTSHKAKTRNRLPLGIFKRFF